MCHGAPNNKSANSTSGSIPVSNSKPTSTDNAKEITYNGNHTYY